MDSLRQVLHHNSELIGPRQTGDKRLFYVNPFNRCSLRNSAYYWGAKFPKMTSPAPSHSSGVRLTQLRIKNHTFKWEKVAPISTSFLQGINRFGQSICRLKALDSNISKNTKFDRFFDVTLCHVVQCNINIYFLGILQHEKKIHRGKTIWLSTFPNS